MKSYLPGLSLELEKDVENMSALDKNIAVNLKRIRKAKNMSLDMLAEQTGVSKSMLGQIERGESNPTVTTIGKIIDGIKVPFEELIQEPKPTVSVISKDLATAKEKDKDCRIYAYFPYEKNRNFEAYAMEIRPGGRYHIAPKGEHTEEYIMVSRGTLTLRIEETCYEIKQGDAVRLLAEQEHFYLNQGKEPLVLNITFAWDIGAWRA
ncbi:MAG: XRE family transcriptional regulator [Eubacteriales bacterium]|nr:XRE family transcriptional regulator [Eubacteriales bacterium]